MLTHYQTDPGKVRSHNENSVTIVKNLSGDYLLMVVDYDELVKNKINVQMRREMGKGIKGACGQLKASHESNL